MDLNIGCGQHYADGWMNIDLHSDGPHPDLVCSLLDLPFPDGSVERVYCGHVLEHIAREDMPQALSEVRRVLTDEGALVVVGPDIHLTRLHEPVLVDAVLNGGNRWPGDEHRWVSTGDATLGYLLAAGFDAYLTSIVDVPDDWPVVGRPLWQFAIYAKKEA